MENLFVLIASVFIILQTIFTCVPLGNDRISFKRLPFISAAIIILNVVIFIGTTPFIEAQDLEIAATRHELFTLIERVPMILGLKEVKQKLQDAGLVQEGLLITEEKKFDLTTYTESVTVTKLGSAQIEPLLLLFNQELDAYEKARHDHLYYQLGLAPNGEWKLPQLVTHMFMHGGLLHLVGNMLFFFALGGALEERWGRAWFSAFYLFIGLCACLPYLIKPDHLPLIGASGAISGVMGAFAASMSKTKIKIGWLTIPLAIFFLIARKKPWGMVRIPALLVLGLYFLSDYSSLMASRLEKGAPGGVAYLAHVSGFFFGVFFALLFEAFKPIQANRDVRNYALQPVVKNEDGEIIISATVTQALEMMQRGEILKALYKLKYYIVSHPDDMEAIKLLAQAYKGVRDFAQFNHCSVKLINHYLAANDKEAALMVYMDLLSVLSFHQLRPHLPAYHWMMIYDYLRASGRNREAAIEYERLADANRQNMLAARAYVQGGEAALSAYDRQRAVKLFENALNLKLPETYQSRARRGLEMCQHILSSPPK
ncbi:MAG: rhomboid family intramembrane serine protease [Acidobacteria bacterium]|nr:rhomboid family intramembrane serine protease [Acidobacteriota bacterium]